MISISVITIFLTFTIFANLATCAPIPTSTSIKTTTTTTTTITYFHPIHNTEEHSRLTYPALYNVCVSWSPSPHDHACSRVRLDNDFVEQNQQGKGGDLLDETFAEDIRHANAGDLISTSPDRKTGSSWDRDPSLYETLETSNIGGKRCRMPEWVKTTLTSGPSTLARLGRTIFSWLDSLSKTTVVVLLVLSWLAQVLLVCVMAYDVRVFVRDPIDSKKSWNGASDTPLLEKKAIMIAFDDTKIMNQEKYNET